MILSFFRHNRLFLVNITSSSGLLTAGDLFVQLFYEKKNSLDTRRLSATLITGAVMGAQGHIWYSYLDRIFPRSTWHNVLRKTTLDQFIAAPAYAITYIIGTSILEGRTSSSELISDIQINFLPIFLADFLIYGPIQILNFRYIPSFYRVPFLSFSAFLFDAFMSAYKHQHDDQK